MMCAPFPTSGSEPRLAIGAPRVLPVEEDFNPEYSGAKVGMTSKKVAQRILELATARPSLLPGRRMVTIG
jgi:hypothetical protein